ncbi:MAG TPA: hypothetical protein PK175_08315 [Syntrophales bacterium]|jgi:hypothetical protein|nr:hypothetical protein [Syntrophales bacterium]HON23271.1 hypothetical protein [Syntrophales bacterium]HOU78462.1 hypothetical protein [Syntrophales bacterium]HPC33307.1 hypothetical protein [Syntrophales bacterium]HQG34859.1 hypothetical protein [Syntrophales bacterium]
MVLSSSAEKLKKMIDKAIEDHEITILEYEKILHLASEDNKIDAQERALLQTLQDLIESGAVKRVQDRR